MWFQDDDDDNNGDNDDNDDDDYDNNDNNDNNDDNDDDDYDENDKEAIARYERRTAKRELKRQALERLRQEHVERCSRLAKNDETLVVIEDLELSYHDCELNDDSDMVLLGNSLVGNTHLKSLEIIECCTRGPIIYIDPDIRVLCQGISQSRIERLKVKKLYDDEVESYLLEAAKMLPTLQRLDLEDVRRDLVLATLLQSQTELLPNVCKLAHLDLNLSEIGDSGMLALSQGLVDNRWLLALAVKRDTITDIGITHFCQYWSNESPLQELDLTGNSIGSHGAQMLLSATAQHSAMRKLVLYENRLIGHEGLELIGEQLAHIGLNHLDIGSCVKLRPRSTPEARNAACRALANGLRANTSLVTFHVGENQLGALGAQMLMQAVAAHPCLQKLSLANDETIGLQGVKLIGHELAGVRLREFDLDGVVSKWPEPQTKLAHKAGQALLNGVVDNVYLKESVFSELHEMWMAPIQFFTRLNRICRPLMSSDVVTPSVWPHVFLVSIKLT